MALRRRAIVIGAGPTGIAAAIGAADRGFDVNVLESNEIGASLRTWGATRFFSPLHMNVTARMSEILGSELPQSEALLTGDEYVERVLLPLTEREPLQGRVHCGMKVVAVGRRGLTRGDYAGHPLRAEKPFRVVTSSDDVFESEVVIDASGGLRVPRAFGFGGLPALGERTLHLPVIRTLGSLGSEENELRGRRILVVGAGHSAANAILALEQLAASDAALRVIWATHSANRRPCAEVMHDPLPERRDVVARANELAERPPNFLRVERKAMVERVEQTGDTVIVHLTGNRKVEVDRIAAFTGYRPDASFLTELALDISPVTEGGARLNRAISNVTDCLAVPKVASADLESGEPGYVFAGSRSYGRSNAFLLKTGFAQLDVLLDALAR
jgi:thioredoxin reductase